VQEKQDKEELNIVTLIDNHIINDQREKEDGDSDKGDQDGLRKFTQPRFPVYFSVCSDQSVQSQPEEGNDRNAIKQLTIHKDVTNMTENVVVDGPFPVNEKERPGYKSCKKIGNYIFNNL
jgi:hypothetical protein